MPGQRYDYRGLEEQFVRGSMSIRELCRLNAIPDARASSIHRVARMKDANGRTWYDKRALFLSRSADKAIDRMASNEASRRVRRAQVEDHLIDALDRALDRFDETLRATVEVERNGVKTTEPKVWIYPKDLAALMDRAIILLGREPAEVDEEQSGLSGSVLITAGADTDFGIAALARLGELAGERSRGVEPRTVGGSPLPDGSEPRPN